MRKQIKHFMLTSATFAICATTSARFVTWGWLTKNVHGQITKTACQSALVSYWHNAPTIDSIIAANKAQDTDEVNHIPQDLTHPGDLAPNEKYNPAHHFDRNLGETSQKAFTRGRTYVFEQKSAAEMAFSQSNLTDALRAIGGATHAIQDFYSHSNFIDLAPADQSACLEALFDLSKSPSPTLKITGYDKVTGLDLPNDDYNHSEFNKDGKDILGRESSESKKVVGGKTKHEIAVTAAISATKRFLDSVHTP